MIPKHTAIIMDGNGRWAENKGMPRVFGHENGVRAVKKIVEEASKHKIEYLTLFTFSIENWNRPSNEVDTLMRILVQTLKDEFDDIFNNNIKLNAIGDLDSLPDKVNEELESIIDNTKKNTGMVLTLARVMVESKKYLKQLRRFQRKLKMM